MPDPNSAGDLNGYVPGDERSPYSSDFVGWHFGPPDCLPRFWCLAHGALPKSLLLDVPRQEQATSGYRRGREVSATVLVPVTISAARRPDHLAGCAEVIREAIVRRLIPKRPIP
jgi:hypothetical protein